MHPSLLLSTFAGIYEQVYQNRPFVLAVVSVLMVPVNRNFQMLLQIKIINYNLTIIFASVSIQVKRCVKYSTTTTIIYKYTNDVALHIILHKFNIHVQLKNRKWDKLIKTVKYHEKVLKKLYIPILNICKMVHSCHSLCIFLKMPFILFLEIYGNLFPTILLITTTTVYI